MTVWLVLLGVVFLAEYAVMLVLPWLVRDGSSHLLESAVDAVVLAMLLAPALWWTIVRPLTEVNRLHKQFLADLFAQIESDRRRTAYELHDGVGQSLTVLISGLRSAKSCRVVEDCAGRVNGFQRLAESALMEVRRLALGLRPSLLDDFGLAAALERLVEDVRANHPVHLSLDVAQMIGLKVPEHVATAVFRIVQEALANVMKHSQATEASVAVRTEEGNVVIEVNDNGSGIEAARLGNLPAGHLGLRGMGERAELLGGELVLESSPGMGTRITVLIPIGESSLG